jgi:hypothetical protein
VAVFVLLASQPVEHPRALLLLSLGRSLALFHAFERRDFLALGRDPGPRFIYDGQAPGGLSLRLGTRFISDGLTPIGLVLTR